MEAEVRTGAISFFWIELFVMQRLTRTLLGVLMITLVLVSAAVAGPYEDGTAAQFNGDYASALRLWRPLADQGDTRAQYGVGSMYERGQGVPQNYAEAARWYHRAAELGDVSMQFDLGSMYHFGQVVSQNYTEAVRWYRRAADQGSIRAQN